jgi:serine/threonine protein kinase
MRMTNVGQPTSPHTEIGDYRPIRELAPGRTLLAVSRGGREVVLKRIAAECLIDRGELHPSVKDRLTRVRELPEKSVANLHGVEREGEFTYTVWDYIPGVTFADDEISTALPLRELLLVARELVLTVESLHTAGLVHGGIKGTNVVIDPNRCVRLTHVSPLLYDDPRHDGRAVLDLLCDTLARRHEAELPAGKALLAARAERIPLRELASRLALLTQSPEATARGLVSPERGGDARLRSRSLVGAAIAAGVGLSIAAGVWWYVAKQRDPSIPGPADLLQSAPSSPTVAVERE